MRWLGLLSFGCCAVLCVSGCQELPPGVLAGDQKWQSTQELRATTTASARGVSDSALQSQVPQSSHEQRLAQLEYEVSELRADRDRLQTQLTAALEQAVETQAELIALYRDRAERLQVADDQPKRQ